MVSLRDTAISLHILQQRAKICLNFIGGGGGCSVVVKTQSAKICTKSQNRVFFPIWAQILPCHFLEGLASQIVSHILRMWRLIIFSHNESRGFFHPMNFPIDKWHNVDIANIYVKRKNMLLCCSLFQYECKMHSVIRVIPSLTKCITRSTFFTIQSSQFAHYFPLLKCFGVLVNHSFTA